MTETAADTAASLNGHAPAAGLPPEADAPCEDCATGGEKGLAVLAGIFALFLAAMAIDMFTGGKLSGYVREQVSGE